MSIKQTLSNCYFIVFYYLLRVFSEKMNISCFYMERFNNLVYVHEISIEIFFQLLLLLFSFIHVFPFILYLILLYDEMLNFNNIRSFRRIQRQWYPYFNFSFCNAQINKLAVQNELTFIVTLWLLYMKNNHFYQLCN